MNKEKGMKSIWYLVGLILLAIGILVFIAGLFNLSNPADKNIRLAYLHTNIWWGALIIITGVIYIVKNKDKYTRVD
jgi:uncharacterized membrane protein HdeD (DUF308 family)